MGGEPEEQGKGADALDDGAGTSSHVLTGSDAETVAAYARDRADQQRIDELRQRIAAFLEDPPESAFPLTLSLLTHAVERLGEDSARLVRRWN